MKVKVYAKLNLTLQVGAKQGAFHSIDSVATSVDIYDTVEVVKRPNAHINVSGVPSVAREQNTAYKAAHALAMGGVDITVHKGIPFGGGLGGSSADAAAVIYCMCKLFNADIYSPKIHQLCTELGSDISFMLFGGLGRLTGKGDEVSYYKLAAPLYFALTTFDASMSSGEIYSSFDKLGVTRDISHSTTSDTVLNLLQQGASGKAITLFGNDLQQATLAVSNYASDYLRFVRSHNLRCNMTGSGSAHYVACVTKSDAEKVCELLNANGFSTVVCKSVNCGIEEID